ncbi:MAG: hypothetical protein KJ579_01785 [Verrucomicrobia bacterium]|nr:hypothetical protein [Verrucomicrobiota bacterium]
MNWTVLDVAYVLNAVPLSHRVQIQASLDTTPGFAAKVAEILAATRREFRTALANTPDNELDPDETKLPETCMRHAVYIVEYEINRILGNWEPDLSALIRAEVYLRALYETKAKLEPETADPVPTYGPPEAAEERSLP